MTYGASANVRRGSLISMGKAMKTCISCKQDKPLSDYYRHKGMADGHLNKCKECQKRNTKTNQILNAEYVREYNRARGKTPERRAAAAVRVQRWEAADKRRKSCHKKVARAIARGDLVRGVCEECGYPDVHAHHDDYDKPLEVRWFCAVHHRELHLR
jgi:hypothetical protein